MDDLGATSNAFTSKEGTCYYLSGAAEDIFKFNVLVSDMAMNMSLPADELERERGAILEEINMYADDPTTTMVWAADEASYSGQAYGRTILGPSSNIRTFDRDIFERFRNKHYHAGNLIVTVAGNVDPAKILRDIDSTAGQMRGGPRSTFTPAKFKGGEFRKTWPGQQMNMMMAFQSSASGKPENMAESVMTQVLSGGMSSRLFAEVREKRGLVYGIQAGSSRTFDSGKTFIYAGTTPDKVAKLVPVVCDELSKLRDDLVSDAELARAKKRLYVASLSEGSAQARMSNNASTYNLNGRVRTKDEFRAAVENVTKEDVRNAARAIFTTKPTLSSVGPSHYPEYSDIENRLAL